jgi:hypothetical protein
MTRTDVTFDDENDAIRYIGQRLAETLPESLAAAVTKQFEVFCGLDPPLEDWPVRKVDRARRGRSFEVDIGAPFLGPWTVREQDLGEVATIAALLAAYAASESSKGLDSLVELTMAAFCMVWRLRRRGVSVNPLQRDVLIAIRRRGTASLDTLATDARTMSAEWSRDDIVDALRELSAIRLNNGTVVALVHEASDERWSTDARGLWEVPFGAIG